MEIGEEIHAPKTLGILQEDGIFLILHEKETYLEIADAKAIVQKWIDVSNGIKYPHLIDFRGRRVSQAKETREYFATTRDLDVCVSATAILADELSDNMIGNFYVKFHKPLIPTKVFHNETEARAWLYQFL